MTLGLVQYVLGAQVPRRRRAAARAGRIARRGAALKRRRCVGRRRRCRRAGVRGRHVHRRDADHRRRRSPTPPATCCSSSSVVFFAWLFFAGDWTPDERKRLYRDRRAVPRRGAVLVGVRAGRLDAQPVRRSQHADIELLGCDVSRAAGSSRCNRSSSSSFAPVFAWLWVRLGQRRAVEPGQVRRSACSCVGARLRRSWSPPRSCRRPACKVSPWWLIVTYLLHTCGELCLSPVGLSAMTKLAPRAHRRPDDGRLVPGDVGRQLPRRPGRRRFYETMPLPRLFGAVAAFVHRGRRRDARAVAGRSSD